MTDPIQAVNIRRIYYASGTPPVPPILYDNPSDPNLPNINVLDTVLEYNGLIPVQGYTFNGTRQVENSSDSIGDALRADAVVYWGYEEESGNFIDLTGNGNDINIFSGTTARVAGKVGNGLHINSTDAQAGLAASSGLSLYPNSYGISFWIKFTETQANLDEHPILGKSGPNETNWEFGLYCLRLSDSPIGLELFFYTLANFVDSSADPLLSENVFYHIMIERDNSGGNFNLYVDNVLRSASPILEGDTDVTNGPFYFGDFKSSVGTQKFIVDEFLVKHDAFTSDERTYLYNAGAGRSLY